MKFLLDTHALLWWLADDDRLGPRARSHIEDPGNDILMSVVCLWEIAIKVRIGKLSANIEEVADAIEMEAFVLLGIQRAHLTTLAGLPMHQRDPFDHLLIAQSIAENASFITDDRYAERYPVRMLPCSGEP